MANSLTWFVYNKGKTSLRSEIKPKVTFITSSMNLGGAERQLLLLCNQLKMDMSIQIITLDATGPMLETYEQQFPDILKIDSKKYSLPVVLYKLVASIKSTNPDIVITWLYKADILGGIAAKLVGKAPVIWSARNSSIPSFNILKRSMLVFFANRIPTFIVANGKPAIDFHKSIGYPESKIRRIPNLLAPWTRKVSSNSQLLKSYRPVNELRIGIASRQISGKGILETISSVLSFPTTLPKITLLLIGQQTEESKAWEKKGLYFGYSACQITEDEDLASWFAGLDLYLMPSTSWESQPNSLFEAIAIGCPVLCSDRFELDIDLPPSLKYKTSDPDALRETLTSYLLTENNLVVENVSMLRMYIENMSNPQSIKNLWKTLIENAINREKQ